LQDLIHAKILVTGQVQRETRGKDTICRLAYSIKEYSAINNQLVNSDIKDESEKPEKHIDEKKIEKLQQLISSLQEENVDLRSNLAKVEHENSKLQHQLKIHKDFNQAYEAESRKATNHFISSVMSTVEWYSKQKITAEKTHEFKANVITAATDVQNHLRNFTKS
jgi:predicted  nucleic acid-binding Zn-ribbon protein